LAAKSGQLIYRFKVGGNIYSSPVISAEGNVYVGSSNGKVVGLRGAAGPAQSGWPMFRREARRLSNVALP
jgi:outer membrane protein assembly factor BamB